MLLASHNSGTGERPKDLFTWLGLPFFRCQTKTLQEQYMSGVRLFDLHLIVDEYNGLYYLAHGFGRFNKTLSEALQELDKCSKWNDSKPVYVIITYEGKLYDEEEEDFQADIWDDIRWTSNIVPIAIGVKNPRWHSLWVNQSKRVQFSSDFKKIKGWRWLLPIPAIYNYIWSDFKLNDNVYSMREFV